MILKRVEVEEVRLKVNEILHQQQSEFNLNLYNIEEEISLGVYQENTIIGGIVGKINDRCMHINLLALATEKEYRNQGLVQTLLDAIIHEAKQKRCTTVTLTTLDFQAKDYYLKQGFEIFGVLEDAPTKGITKYYLVKRI